MESDVVKVFTHDKKECLITFICGDGFKNLVIKNFIEKSKDFTFGRSKDVYMIDVRLSQMLREISHNSVLSCGASVCMAVEYMNGGGIIGDPFSKSESADDGMERQKNGLWCIAYSGKMGCAFDADENTAFEIYKKIEELDKKHVKNALKAAETVLLEKSDTFIIASDGCGNGAFRYVSAGKNGKIKSIK